MSPDFNVRVVCNGDSFWFKNVPAGTSYLTITNKCIDLKSRLATSNPSDWEFERIEEIPYGVIPINWENL